MASFVGIIIIFAIVLVKNSIVGMMNIGGPGTTTGCAGDQGGFVKNPKGRCHTTGGPNNEEFSCP
jgi:hypothetical protein